MENFRKKILSWGAKLLLGLLIISFALWGIGDYTMGGKDENEIRYKKYFDDHEK